jgi:hypothetical protein
MLLQSFQPTEWADAYVIKTHKFLRSYNMNVHLPAHWALNLTDNLAAYLVSKFRQRLHGSDIPHILPPLHLSTQLICDCELILDQLIAAYNNPGKLHFPIHT